MISAWLAVVLASPPLLEWRAPVGCPNGDAVESDVRRLLTASPPSNLSVAADVTQEGRRRWRVRVRFGDSDMRELTGETCASVADAAAVVIALTLSGMGGADAPPKPTLSPTGPTAGPAPQTEPPVLPAAILESPDAPTDVNPRPVKPWSISLAGEVFSEHGALTRYSPGMGAWAELATAHLDAAVGLNYLPPRTARHDGAAASLQLGYMGARAGVHTTFLGITFGAFALAEAGGLWTHGNGSGGTRENAAWLAVGGGCRAAFPITTTLNLAPVFNVVRPTRRARLTFERDDGELVVVHEMAALSLRGGLALEYVFP